MEVKTSFGLKQSVYFMPGNVKKVVCAEVIQINIVVKETALNGGTVEQEELYTMQGGYGPLQVKDLFLTRQDMLNSL